MIKAVLFDLSGTLVKGDISAEVETKDEGLSRVMREADYDVYYQEMQAARHFVMFIDYPRGRASTPYEYHCKVAERLEIPVNSKLVEKLASKAAELEKIKLYPDVIPTINALMTREIKTAIVTTIPSWRFTHALENANLRIDFICTAREANAVKPNPKIYLTALNKLGVKPNQAIMVGDDLATDVIPPKKLGMKAVWLHRRGKLEQGQADYVISSLTELLELI